jgi:hypothetical protein
MPNSQRKETIEYAVLVITGGTKTILPKSTLKEAEEVVMTYNSETPLFGDSVQAYVIARKKTVTVDYGNWGKIKPRP